jgi:hypothetical protein|tara:strand:+ start:569 stop:685 length:117 start_codon:yes stop_codon:yes gene_type:complete
VKIPDDNKFQLEQLLKRIEDLERRLKYLENLLIGEGKK